MGEPVVTVYAHIFLDDKITTKLALEHVPRVGDTVRLGGDKYAIVTEVIWCLDELDLRRDRVNIRTVTETEAKT